MARLNALPGPGGYRALRVNAATTAPQGASALIGCSTSTAVGAPGSATLTVTANAGFTLEGLRVGMLLYIGDGTGTAEVVRVTAFTYTNAAHTTGTITAVFANTHSGTNNLWSLTGGDLGTVIVSVPGTGMTLTLYDGHPNIAGGSGAGKVIGTLFTATGAGQFQHSAATVWGVFYAYTGTTPGDLTLHYRTHGY
jgi:hypothetical protein